MSAERVLEVRNGLEAARALLAFLGVDLGKDWGEVSLRYTDRGVHVVKLGRDFRPDALARMVLAEVDSPP